MHGVCHLVSIAKVQLSRCYRKELTMRSQLPKIQLARHCKPVPVASGSITKGRHPRIWFIVSTLSASPMIEGSNPAQDNFRIIIVRVLKVESSNLASCHNPLILVCHDVVPGSTLDRGAESIFAVSDERSRVQTWHGSNLFYLLHPGKWS